MHCNLHHLGAGAYGSRGRTLLASRRVMACIPSHSARKVVCQADSFPADPAPGPRLEISIEEVEARLGSKPKQKGPQVSSPGGKGRRKAAQDKEKRTGFAPLSRAGERAREKRLAEAAKAQELGLRPKQLKAKLKELLLLLPDAKQPLLLSLAPDSLKDLVSDTAALAARIVQVVDRFNAARCQQQDQRASGFLTEHLELLTSAHWEQLIDSMPLACLRGHTGSVESIAVAPDGRHAVSGSWDKTLRVWDLRRQASVATLQGHTDEVLAAAISPDGRHAVSGGRDKTLRVWDLQSLSCVATLQGHTDWVRAVAVAPDGRHAVSGSDDSTLRVWDLRTHTCLATLQGDAGWVMSVAISPDGLHAVSGSRDSTLRVWDLQSRSCVATLQGHTDWVRSVAIAPDGKQAVSGSDDSTLRVWDLQSRSCLATLKGHRGWVLSVAITPDGRQAVSCGSDNALRVWDLQAHTCVGALQWQGQGFFSPLGATGMRVALTPDGRQAVVGGFDPCLRLWDLRPHGGLWTTS